MITCTLNDLTEKVDNFTDLARSSAEFPPSYTKVVSVVFSLLHEIQQLELCGLSRSELVSLVTPVREVLRQSPFFKRIQDWPLGYQGDFETIEYLMSAVNKAPQGSIAYQLERYGLTSPAAQQHRNKVLRQAQLILYADRVLNDAKVLSIACGGSPDIAHVQHLLRGRTAFTLYDYDSSALAYSRQRLTWISDRCTCIQGNVLRIDRDLRSAGVFDVVLAGGLFDYLRDRSIVRLLRFVWSNLLSETGTLFFTNMSPENPDRVWIEYLGDWILIMRREVDIADLCVAAGIPKSSLSISRDETNCTILVEARKSCAVNSVEPHWESCGDKRS